MDIVQISLGTQQVETDLQIVSPIVKGVGKLTFDYRMGSVRYVRNNDVNFNMLMAQFGAVNSTVVTNVNVPINIFINNVLYSGTVNFHYAAVRDKIGKGQ